MKATLFILFIAIIVSSGCKKSKKEYPTGNPAYQVEAVKIWDQAPHSAFTDLIRFQNLVYPILIHLYKFQHL